VHHHHHLTIFKINCRSPLHLGFHQGNWEKSGGADLHQGGAEKSLVDHHFLVSTTKITPLQITTTKPKQKNSKISKSYMWQPRLDWAHSTHYFVWDSVHKDLQATVPFGGSAILKAWIGRTNLAD
jgi:hypothetical protein